MKESRDGFCRRGKGRSFHVDGPKTEKAREPTVESLVRGIWRLRVSKAERRVREGVSVKLKTVTEIGRSSARDTFIAESVYLVLNSLLDWKPVDKFKQRCYAVSFTSFQYEARSTVPYATKALDRGNRQARKERTAVVKA